MCSELSLELLGKEADIAGRDAEIKELERQNDELRAEKADLEDRLADAQRGQESVQRELESERLVRKAEEMTTSRLRGERDIAMLEESRHRTTIASLQPLLRTLGHSIVNVAGMLDDGSNQTPPF
jgi:chromosome segregation ATPase